MTRTSLKTRNLAAALVALAPLACSVDGEGTGPAASGGSGANGGSAGSGAASGHGGSAGSGAGGSGAVAGVGAMGGSAGSGAGGSGATGGVGAMGGAAGSGAAGGVGASGGVGGDTGGVGGAGGVGATGGGGAGGVGGVGGTAGVGGTGGTTGGCGDTGPLSEVLFEEDFQGLGTPTYNPGSTFRTATPVLGAWHVIAARGVGARIGVSGGNAAFWFPTLTNTYSDNRIDRCVKLEPTKGMSFAYDVWQEVDSNNLRVRVSPTFYTDMCTCQAEVDSASGSGHLTGNLDNAHWDVRMKAPNIPTRAWTRVRASTDTHVGPQRYAPSDYPLGATAVRFSVKVGDGNPSSNRVVYIDNFTVAQGELGGGP